MLRLGGLYENTTANWVARDWVRWLVWGQTGHGCVPRGMGSEDAMCRDDVGSWWTVVG